MSKFFRALFISAVATVVAVAVANMVSGRRWALVGRSLRSREPEGDEGGLTADQREMLLDELDAQL